MVRCPDSLAELFMILTDNIVLPTYRCARISIMVTINRLVIPWKSLNKITRTMLFLFSALYVVVISEKIWVCSRTDDWHSTVDVQCFLADPVPATELSCTSFHFNPIHFLCPVHSSSKPPGISSYIDESDLDFQSTSWQIASYSVFLLLYLLKPRSSLPQHAVDSCLSLPPVCSPWARALSITRLSLVPFTGDWTIW